jgi:hypothetical protein
LIGRTIERERLAAAFCSTASGEGRQLVIIGGEAGQGKTTLAAELARTAHAEGAVVLYGRADEVAGIPYEPFVEALGHYLGHADAAVLATHAPVRLSDLGRLVPEVRRRLPDLTPATSTDPDAERWIAFGAVAGVLNDLSRRAPVVIVLDDLHWADPSSLLLLRHLAHSDLGRVLLLAIYRDSEAAATHPLTDTLVALHREAGVQRVGLGGLADSEVVDLVEAAAGRTLDEDEVALAHALHRDTDGNPFFVGEILRHLAETGVVVQRDGAWHAAVESSSVGLPDSVHEVIAARIARLEPGAQQILSTAATIGQEFEIDLLTAASGLDEDSVLNLLEAAAATAVVAELGTTPGRYRFTHALFQHGLYERLGATRQARLHRRVAETLETLCEDNPDTRAAELARHWLSAHPPDLAKVATYARLAGDQALAALSPSEGLRWYGEAVSALAHVPDDRARASCLVGLGEAQAQSGDVANRSTLLEAARLAQSLGDIDTLLRAAVALIDDNGIWSATGTSTPEGEEARDRALAAAIGPEDSTARVRLLALGGSPEDQGEALAMARRLGDPATIIFAIRCQDLWSRPGLAAELKAGVAQVEELAAETPDAVTRFWAACWRALMHLQVGGGADIRRCHDAAFQIASEVGQPALLWQAVSAQGWSSLLAGNANRAEALATQALEIAAGTGQPNAMRAYGAQLAAIRWHQGRLDELVDMLAPFASDATAVSAAFRAALALALADSDHVDARSILDNERRSGFPAPDNNYRPTYLAVFAVVAAAVRDKAAAKILYDRLEPWSHLVIWGANTVSGAVALPLGSLATVLGRHEVAATHFARALEIHERLSAPFFIARTQLEWARIVLARAKPEDHDRALAMLEKARDLAHTYRCAVVQRHAEDLIPAAMAASVPAGDTGGPDHPPSAFGIG